jgi:hypothetical protein
VDRRESSRPVGPGPVSDATPDGPDDELAYDSGGLSFGLMGVMTICAVLGCCGFILGLRIPTTAVVVAAFGVPGSAWVYYRMGIAYPRRRAAKMREAAAALGLVYRADVPPQQLGQLSQMPPFSAGVYHRACNLIVGTYQGMPVRLLDYYYRASHGRAKLFGTPGTDWWQTVVLIPEVSGVPEFQLAPQGFMHRVAALLGSQDIQFSGDATRERFSRHYLLRGPQEPAVRVAFDGRAVEYLADHPGWTVTCRGGTLAVWRTAPTKAEARANFKLTPVVDPGFRYVAPAAIPRLLARAVAIRRLFQESGTG